MIVIPECFTVIPTYFTVIPECFTVIPDSIRDPVLREHWIADLVRNDRLGRNDRLVSATTNRDPR